MGTSSRTGDPVSSMIGHALWPSVQLLFWATIVSVTVAIMLGVYSAMKQYSIGDYFFTGLSYAGIAMPDFWFALMAIALLVTGPTVWFHLDQPIFYSIGLHSEGVNGLNLDYFRHLALPVLTLTFTSVAAWSRFLRAEMLGVLNADYVRTARAKGLGGARVVWRHALRNALIPVVTVVGLSLPTLVGGAVLTETVFAWPGIGRLAVGAVFERDYPVIMGVNLMVAAVVISANLLTDLAYCVIDPRISYR